MPYKTYKEQIEEHVAFIRSFGLDVDATTLHVNEPGHKRKCVRFQAGEHRYDYQTNLTKFGDDKEESGLCGLMTFVRGPGGNGRLRTYGLQGESSSFAPAVAQLISDTEYEEAAKRAYGFWQHCSPLGESEYLKRKGVGAYGIRFHSSDQFGNVAVVPMYDERGRLWNRQLLNSDGTKRMAKDGRTTGLFHKLSTLTNGKTIGIAEGYVTAATCQELSGIPMVCAFSSENLVFVAKILIDLTPSSLILIFADNDRHLPERNLPNKGLEKADEARTIAPNRITIIAPDFGAISPTKDASDWNDLARLLGRDVAKRQMLEKLQMNA